jgi:hypothetical protein
VVAWQEGAQADSSRPGQATNGAPPKLLIGREPQVASNDSQPG